MRHEQASDDAHPRRLRLEPRTEGFSPLGRSIEALSDRPPPLVRPILANDPTLVAPVTALIERIMFDGPLSGRDREILALRVAWQCRADYILDQHGAAAAVCGIGEDEISALAEAAAGHRWSVRDRALISAADDLCEANCVSEETWRSLTSFYDASDLVEILFVVGLYRMMSGFVNSVGLTPATAQAWHESEGP
jgi:alkylhydroperoxidase family enzyme